MSVHTSTKGYPGSLNWDATLLLFLLLPLIPLMGVWNVNILLSSLVSLGSEGRINRKFSIKDKNS